MTVPNIDGGQVIIRDSDLTGADLHGVYLARSDMTLSCMDTADLSSTDLSGSTLYACLFRRANMAGSILNNANLEGANFQGADLTGAYMRVGSVLASRMHCTHQHALGRSITCKSRIR